MTHESGVVGKAGLRLQKATEVDLVMQSNMPCGLIRLQKIRTRCAARGRHLTPLLAPRSAIPALV